MRLLLKEMENMCEDKMTVLRNEFNSVLDSVGEDGLSNEETVRLAIELETKLNECANQ